MNHNKNADTLFFLLLFTKSQREKKLKKDSLQLQALKKGEKRRILRIIYDNIYRIPKISFQ